MLEHHRLDFPLWRITLATLAVAIVTLLFPRIALPQQPLTRISCSSDGGRVFCEADTHGGVKLERHYLDSGACVEGESWGYNEHAIWVDRGCAGEFVLGVQPRGSISGITPGTIMTVRTTGLIASPRSGSVYEGVVAEDVFDGYGRVAIARGSLIQMRVGETGNGEMALDLDSVVVNGQPYSFRSAPARLGQGVSAAPAGDIVVHGPRIYIPPNTLLTFELEK